MTTPRTHIPLHAHPFAVTVDGTLVGHFSNWDAAMDTAKFEATYGLRAFAARDWEVRDMRTGERWNGASGWKRSA